MTAAPGASPQVDRAEVTRDRGGPDRPEQVRDLPTLEEAQLTRVGSPQQRAARAPERRAGTQPAESPRWPPRSRREAAAPAHPERGRRSLVDRLALPLRDGG